VASVAITCCVRRRRKQQHQQQLVLPQHKQYLPDAVFTYHPDDNIEQQQDADQQQQSPKLSGLSSVRLVAGNSLNTFQTCEEMLLQHL
jgi:hypothetical protein